ncbi:hypothetical protein BBW65_07285 [Helicobacter enhydrae]|uniref:Endopeptidase n=1 Tax=Helicobacter enhydrae TaxID=222136 RepID=A0A1B1U794_9HELI|nr:peptidoglycan DD-metalloendopeptidase family protein [Helicobacter enhydrae]ANV98610.1 hypothetical protein BBW65_07285 [Helicobacter enhydrae]
MRHLILIFCFYLFSYGAIGENRVWQNGYTFLKFLEDNKIPLRLYYNLPAEDQELSAEIYAGVEYQVLKNENNELLQALIPIGDDVQIHIYRQNFQYKFALIPIKYFQKNKQIFLKIQKSPHQDIFERSNDLGLANEVLNIYKNSINFKKEVMKDDKLGIIYTRKYRFGYPFASPMIQSAVIETNKAPNYLISYNNGRYYNLQAKEVTGFLFQMPLDYVHITSNFTHARKHPVLKQIIRPHYGIDLRAKIGTPIKSAGSGKIISAGNKGGYGKAVEILHEGGFKTLYAHLSKIDPRIKVGNYVKQGQVIGRSGNTGISSGPHLHFGLYKNGRPINPLGSIKTTRSQLKGKEKEKFLQQAKDYKQRIDEGFAQLLQTQGT